MDRQTHTVTRARKDAESAPGTGNSPTQDKQVLLGDRGIHT